MYKCDICGKEINGVHTMTVREDWCGFGPPPVEAIVHVCNSKKCWAAYERKRDRIQQEERQKRLKSNS
jgi:hypothetical protein